MSNQTIYQALKLAGLTSEGACGLMGNMKAESGMKSNIAQRGMTAMSDEEYTAAADAGMIDFVNDSVGYGLSQWTCWSRKKGLMDFAKTKHVSVGDEDMQVQYCLKELNDYPGVLSVLKTSTDLKRCSDIVCTDFERPAHNNLDQRYNFALEFYNQFSGMSAYGGFVTQVPDQFKPEMPNTYGQSTTQQSYQTQTTTQSQSTASSGGFFSNLFSGLSNLGSSGNVKMKSAQMPVLKEGDTGAGVAAVQCALKYHKIDLGETGILGVFEVGTTMGVKDFQRRNGLKATGEVTPETWSRLML